MVEKKKTKKSGKRAAEKEPEKPKVEFGKREQFYDLTVPTFERDLLEQEKERISKMTEKSSKAETSIDRKKRDIRMKLRELAKIPPPPPYEPLEPVSKSDKLKEYEKSIRKGKFLDADYKRYVAPERSQLFNFNWLEPYDYGCTFDTVGITRHRIWKSVY